MRLTLTAPAVAFRDCQHCLMYVYDEATGRPFENPPHSGRPIPRPQGTAPPCRIPGAGCPKGTPEAQKGLSPANCAAFQFDRECRAIGRFPDDPLVRRNAALIRQVEEAHERRQWDRFHTAILTLLARRR